MSSIFETYKELLGSAAPVGRERRRGLALEAMIKPFVDETSFDSFGNLVARKRGAGKKIMLSARMDTPTFVVNCIDAGGFLRFLPLGEFDPRWLVGARIRFEGGLEGVIAVDDRERKGGSDLSMLDLYADIAAESTEQATELVPVGSAAVFAGEGSFVESSSSLMGPYCGSISTCAALLEIARRLQGDKKDIQYVFAAQSEVGQRGVKAAVFAIDPDIGICVDAVSATDGREPIRGASVSLGGGPVIKLKDGSALYSRAGAKTLRDAADALGIACQYEILGSDESESAATHYLNRGAMTCGVGIPVRYLRAPTEFLRLADVEGVATLICRALEKAL